MTGRRAVVVLALVVLSAPGLARGYGYLAPDLCPGGATWSEDARPVTYFINRDGSSDIRDFGRLESAVRDSFEAWEEPCCSGFSATYGGDTPYTALDSPRLRGNHEIVLSWRETSWPPQLGHPYTTVAVSRPGLDDCRLVDGTILFNGAYHTFSTTPDGDDRRIRVVATHEAGHLVGLGHSSQPDSTMAPRYHADMATLAADDRAGVCSLYDGASCRCSSAADCSGARTCENGRCTEPSCRDASDCPAGQTCDSSTATCVTPTCTTSRDCTDGYRCSSGGRCVPKCTVCRSCSSQADCGPNGLCADMGGSNKCVTQCGPSTGCPGDSRCFAVQLQSGGEYHLCLNPNADSGETGNICPESYTCSVEESGGDSSDAGGDAGPTGDTSHARCPSLGRTCSGAGTSNCGPDANGCMVLADGRSICTCSCERDRDCGAGNSCVTVGSNSWCFPTESRETSGCDAISCSRGLVCRNGACVAPEDAGVDRADGVEAASETGPVEVVEQSDRGGCNSTSTPPPALPVHFCLLFAVAAGLRRRLRS